MKQSIILIGGGDHCKTSIDVIEQEGKYKIEGIVDIGDKVGEKVLGYPIIGTDDNIPELVSKYSNFFITIGHVINANARRRVYYQLKQLGVRLPVIISPLAHVSTHSKIGEGTIIFPFSIIDVEVIIGNNCIINHATTIGHGAQIENNCHISANCVLGKCLIGEGSFVGINSWINNGVTLPNSTVIGSASNVLKTITEAGIYGGNPAKRIKQL